MDRGNHIKKDGLKKELKKRQMDMIAIGGTIGAGLFLTIGSAISQSGLAELCCLICLWES